MEVYFKRNLLQSYMVIENQLYGDYDMEMLKRNRLPGFLPFKQIEADGAWQSWYEITGLQMLDEYMKQKPVDYELLKRMVLQIDTCMQLAEEYLLVVDDISLAPERTGIRPETGELYFCYLKGENKNSARQFQNLIEQILPNVDHRDRRAVEAVYAIYEIVLMEYFDFADVKKVFTQKDETAENMEENGQMVAEDTVFGMKEETEELPESERTDREAEKRMDKSGMQKEWEKLRGTLLRLKEPFYPEKKKLYRKASGAFGRRQKEAQTELQISFEPDEDEGMPKKTMHPTVLLSDVSGIIGKLNYNGKNGEEDFLIQTENFRIGTKVDEVDACLRSAAVSRIHARITREGEEYYIEDLNSRNGTWIDGELLNYKERRKLKKNARIRFADEEYIFS